MRLVSLRSASGSGATSKIFLPREAVTADMQ